MYNGHRKPIENIFQGVFLLYTLRFLPFFLRTFPYKSYLIACSNKGGCLNKRQKHYYKNLSGFSGCGLAEPCFVFSVSSLITFYAI